VLFFLNVWYLLYISYLNKLAAVSLSYHIIPDHLPKEKKAHFEGLGVTLAARWRKCWQTPLLDPPNCRAPMCVYLSQSAGSLFSPPTWPTHPFRPVDLVDTLDKHSEKSSWKMVYFHLTIQKQILKYRTYIFSNFPDLIKTKAIQNLYMGSRIKDPFNIHNFQKKL